MPQTQWHAKAGVHGGEQHAAAPVAEIVFEAIAIVIQHIEAFVLDFPTAAGGLCDGVWAAAQWHGVEPAEMTGLALKS